MKTCHRRKREKGTGRIYSIAKYGVMSVVFDTLIFLSSFKVIYAVNISLNKTCMSCIKKFPFPRVYQTFKANMGGSSSGKINLMWKS